MLCDTRGMVHNFEVYTGKIMPIEGYPDLDASSNIVLRLSQVVQPNMNHIFYFDNWFSSVNLLVQLAKKEIFTIATERSNRLLGCEMQSEKELKQKGRGSFEEEETTIDGIVVRAVRWFDNRPVTSASTCTSVYSLCTVDRWDRSQRQASVIAVQPLLVNTTKTCEELMH